MEYMTSYTTNAQQTSSTSLGFAVWHHSASLVMPDCDPVGRLCLSTSHTHDVFFFLHIFRFWMWILIMQSLPLLTSAIFEDITVTFSDVITFTEVNLNDGVRDILYNQCKSNTWRFSISFIPWVGLLGLYKNFYPRVNSKISSSDLQNRRG